MENRYPEGNYVALAFGNREGKIVNYLNYSLDYVWDFMLENVVNSTDPAASLWGILKYHHFWKSYLAWVKSSPPAELSHLPYHRDLQRELEKVVGRLDEMIGAMMERMIF